MTNQQSCLGADLLAELAIESIAAEDHARLLDHARTCGYCHWIITEMNELDRRYAPAPVMEDEAPRMAPKVDDARAAAAPRARQSSRLHANGEWLEIIEQLVHGREQSRERARATMWLEVTRYVERSARLPIGPLNEDDDARRDLALRVLSRLEANDNAHLHEWVARQRARREHSNWWSLIRMIATRCAIDYARTSRLNIASRGRPFQWVDVEVADPAIFDKFAHRDTCFPSNIQDLYDYVKLAVTTFSGHTQALTSCAVNSQSDRVVSASLDKTLKIWDIDTGRVVKTLEGHRDVVRSCAVTPDGRRVVSGSCDATLRIWDAKTGETIRTLQGHTDAVQSCALTPDGHHVISASDDRTLKLWSLTTGRHLKTLEGHHDVVRACTVMPDGRRAISASDDKTLRIWELDTGRTLATFEGHSGAVNSCVVMPDDRQVISASDDRTLRIWDVASGSTVAMLSGHARSVNRVAITPDGRRLISVSDDRTLKIWDAATRECVATYSGDAHFTDVAATSTTVCAGDAAGKLWVLDQLPSAPP